MQCNTPEVAVYSPKIRCKQFLIPQTGYVVTGLEAFRFPELMVRIRQLQERTGPISGHMELPRQPARRHSGKEARANPSF